MKFLLLIFIAFVTEILYSQTPEIEWQNTMGGNLNDLSYSVAQVEDGGYIIGGFSESGISGDKNETSRGGYDYWIIKLSSIGEIIWQKTIGGGNFDQMYELKVTSDGGYILGGYSSSGISGDKTEELIGSQDYWVLKLDSLGNIQWQNTIGGSGQDVLWSLQQTFDGGYITSGYSDSDVSGDKSESSFGLGDYWVVKLDSIGEIEWQKTLGGNLNDASHSIYQTQDNGYIIGGSSESGISGNKSEDTFGSFDYWVVKLDSIGNIQWQKAIGGSSQDELFAIQQTTDNGYILGGHSDSGISGNKNESCLGLTDYWVVKLDSIGNIQWQNTIGGDNIDAAFSIEQTSSGGFIIGGQSFSNISGDKSDICFGIGDCWLLKLNSTGDLEWQKTLGGNLNDVLFSVSQTFEEGYILSGFSSSGISGNKSEECQGLLDYWVIKLYPDCQELQESCNGVDDDCDGDIDEGFTFNTYFLDFDGDNFGNELIDSFSCMGVSGYVLDSTDCDDTNSEIYPGAPEILDGYDNNCNELIDEGINSIEDSNPLSFNISPNPNSGNFELEIENFDFNELHVSILNLIGEKIYEIKYVNSNVVEIILPQGFSGIAIVTVFDGKYFFSKSMNVVK